MRTTPISTLLAVAFACGLLVTSAHAQDESPGYNQKIPAKIMTPDVGETRLGTLNFVDGVPLEPWCDKTWRVGEIERVK